MSRWRKWAIWLGGLAGVLLATLAIIVFLVLPSDWFREKLRARLVEEVEKATGGKAEIGAFYWDWKSWHVQVRPFVLHGTEAAGEKPLVRAEAIQVWLHVVSFLKRDIDLSGVEFDHPEINILIDSAGHTNIPAPKVARRSDQDPIQEILNLAVKEFRVQNGYVHYGDQMIPLDLEARNLSAVFDYDRTGPRYQGNVAMERLNLKTTNHVDLTFDVNSKLTLAPDLIRIESARLAMPHSFAESSGTITNLRHPHVNLNVHAAGDLAELRKPLRFPEPHEGQARFDGTVTYDASSGYLIEGKVQGHGIGIEQPDVKIRDIALNAALRMDAHEVRLRNLNMTGLGARVAGQAEIRQFKTVTVNGTMEGLSLKAASQVAGLKAMPYNALLTGPFELTASLSPRARDAKLSSTIRLTPDGGPHPVDGTVQLTYDQRSQRVQLGDSTFKLPSSTITTSGTLGEDLAVTVQSTDLNDLLPAIAIVSDGPPPELPLKLAQGGGVQFSGDVRGALANPQITGTVNSRNVLWEDQKIDNLTAAFSLNQSSLQVRSVSLGQNELRLSGQANVGLANWELVPSSGLSGTLSLRGARIAQVIADAGQKAPVDGTLSADLQISGTYANPSASGQAAAADLSAYGETFDRGKAAFRYSESGLEVSSGELEKGAAKVMVAGAYNHGLHNWKSGRVRFDLTSSGWTVQQINHVQERLPDLGGHLSLRASGTADIRNLEFLLSNLDGQISVPDMTLKKKPVGSVSLDARTQGLQLTIGAAGDLRGSRITGNGAFHLEGDYIGSGSLAVASMKLSTLQDVFLEQTGKEPMPFDGVVGATLTFSGPARKPDQMRSRLEIPKLEIYPTRAIQTRKQGQDLTLRNAGPIVLEATGRNLHVTSAKLVGPETNIEGSGTINLADDRSPWDLKFNGNLNLGVLEDFQPGLLSSGVSTVNATLRGSLAKPQLLGRLKFTKASFYLTDFPNGLDNVNGELLFDQNRATIIDRITAETGGGQVGVTGFVGISGGEFTYRLQARGEDVRIRYPEGVSTTASAQLSLTGTSLHSMLTGVITVKRVSFNQRTDLGSLLAATATPIAAPTTPNEFVRGLLIDVRIESIPNLQFQASMTSNLQAEVTLRIRGTAAKPSLSGRINVNQGDITFFGTKYQIDRGDIAFYNQVKIEPVVDLELETRVRGITVTISVSGTLSKLNVSYRSDPPLQSSEIIALLAVGRTPGTYSAIAAGQTVTQENPLAASGSALLGQAVTSPVSGRLQRFFGVSKLKIDPLLTGVNAIPQARLTLEQQISKDVTLTYVTNLAQANQQIVRVEWDLNRNWSVVALREENGVFGVDFLYKKSFK